MSGLKFDDEGKVLVPEEIKKIKELDYLHILKALYEIPFPIGKKNLIDFLKGNESNKTIGRNRMHKMDNFGSLNYSNEKIDSMLENLARKGMLKAVPMDENKFSRVIVLTEKGIDEIDNPTLHKLSLSFSYDNNTEITEEDKIIFNELKIFFGNHNDEQKKAVICGNKNILCIAGAGSGKTSVLVKRIEFLVKYKSARPEEILAITFTRKARREMARRLANAGLDDVRVETFNSFCESILREYGAIAYSKPMRVMSYGDKIAAMNYTLAINRIEMSNAINMYFTENQIKNKTEEELGILFMNDCFFILDYYKSRNEKLEDFSETAEIEQKEAATIIYRLCSSINEYMEENGLRDFTDQMIDAISLFTKNPELIPKFRHVLVDEYQDVNSSQIKLIGLLNPENIFCVGDPRQSIFGWRGSDIRYIIDFPKKYDGCSIINLTKNYRSKKHIVEVINSAIRDMNLPDLEHTVPGENAVEISNFDSEPEEFDFIIKKIKESKVERKEIFVLARTNRQLKELSQKMKEKGITFIIRNDEINKTAVGGRNDVTLATIHAIKGLEAKIVFVIGCTSMNFPCRASDHPVIEMVKAEEYDKEEEEKRLFYVAMSRAKDKLHLTYSGKKPTYFLSQSIINLIEGKKEEVIRIKEDSLFAKLKKWRLIKSKDEKIPAYCVCTDLTLMEIADKKPQSLKEMEGIYGLGPVKILKYGKEIMDVAS